MSNGKIFNSLSEASKDYAFYLDMKGNDLVFIPEMGKNTVHLLLYPYIQVQLEDILSNSPDFSSLEDNLEVEGDFLIMRDFFREE